MTKEQEDRLRCINGALTVLRCECDGILEKEPDNHTPFIGIGAGAMLTWFAICLLLV